MIKFLNACNVFVYTRSLVYCVFKYLGSECSAVKNRLTIERIDRETYLHHIKCVLLTYHLSGGTLTLTVVVITIKSVCCTRGSGRTIKSLLLIRPKKTPKRSLNSSTLTSCDLVPVGGYAHYGTTGPFRPKRFLGKESKAVTTENKRITG